MRAYLRTAQWLAFAVTLLGAANACEAQRAPVDRAAMVVPLRLTVMIDGLQRGDLDTLYEPATQSLRLSATGVLRFLDDELPPATLERLRQKTDVDGQIALAELAAEGLTAQFDEPALRVRLSIPAKLRATREIPLRVAGTTAAGAIPPAERSAFLNLRSAVTTNDDPTNGTEQNANVGLDGAVNVRGNVLEARGAWNNANAPLWRRTSTRYVRDLPAARVRMSVGDLDYSVRGFQSQVALGGIEVRRENSLQPYRLARPSGQAGFLLEVPATVDFFVNDRLLRTLRLTPGPYDVRSFPFLGGINDARIVITDENGRQQVVEFPFVFDGELVVPGDTEFGYAIGAPAHVVDGELRYRTESLVASMFHRWGVTDALTMEVNAQADEGTRMAGAGAIVTGTPGVARLDGALSRAASQTGFAVRLQYDYRDVRRDNKDAQGFGFGVRYISREFTGIGTSGSGGSFAWDLNARYGRRLFGVGVGAAISYRVGRDAQRDVTATDLYAQRTLTRSLAVSFRLHDEIDMDGTRGQGAFFTLSAQIGDGGQAVAFSRDTASATSRADWRYRPDTGVDRWDALISGERSPTLSDARVDLAYSGLRANLGLDAASLDSKIDGGITRSTTARVSTAFVYADGATGISRPVTDAFAILVPHPALAGQTIGVNRLDSGVYQARVDNLGAAVLPNLTPYRDSRAVLDLRNLPIGIDAGPGVVEFAPAYKSGSKFVIGNGATVFLTATLSTPDGTPVALSAGQILSVDDPTRAPIITFTNRVGRLAAEGLRPGRYIFTLYSAPDQPLEFTIPAEAFGELDLGAWMMPREREEKRP